MFDTKFQALRILVSDKHFFFIFCENKQNIIIIHNYISLLFVKPFINKDNRYINQIIFCIVCRAIHLKSKMDVKCKLCTFYLKKPIFFFLQKNLIVKSFFFRRISNEYLQFLCCYTLTMSVEIARQRP